MALVKYRKTSESGVALGPSPAIWATCPVDQLIVDPGAGWYYMENWFDRTHSYSEGTAANGYLTYQDTGVTITGQVLTETQLNSSSYAGLIGYIQIAGADADNDEGSIQACNGTSNLFCIDKGRGRAWFETIVRFPNIDQVSFFIGLADQAAAAADFMTDDTGAIASDEDVIGFRTLVADADGLDAVYQTASGSEAVVKEAAATLEASTTTGWYRLGITFDGDSTVYYWVNGDCVGSVDCETSGFPDGVAMAPFWALKASVASEKKLDIGWWRGAQMWE